jgi:cytochrome c553
MSASIAPPVLVAIATLLVACAEATPNATIAPATAAPAPAPETAAPVEDRWASLDWEERHDVMTFTVLPNMARAFQRFRGAADPALTCRSCHGADAEAVRYAMPHGLPALDPAHMPSDESPSPDESRVVHFMRAEVTPAMGELIGSPGFGCFRCHPAKGANR